MPKTPDRAESLLRTCIQYGADETKLRDAYARQPASLPVDDRIVAAWSEATGLTPPLVPDASPTSPVLPTLPTPPAPPAPVKIVSSANDPRYTLRDWVIGSAVLAVPVLVLFARCLA